MSKDEQGKSCCGISLTYKTFFASAGKLYCKNHVPKPKMTSIANLGKIKSNAKQYNSEVPEQKPQAVRKNADAKVKYGPWLEKMIESLRDEKSAEALEEYIMKEEQPIDKYLSLRKLEENDLKTFHRVLQKRTVEVLPFVYTPTVGEACQRYDDLNIKTHGLYLRIDKDKGNILAKLKSWARQDIEVIVVTDGERILGLGDLGAGGMGISEGKILLYSAIGGVPVINLLPVCLDVGTNNESLLQNPNYRGIRKNRVVGKEYEEFVQEFMDAVRAWRPYVFVQFEDFANHNAFVILDKFLEDYPCFNDDIQGTATIVLSALLAATRRTKIPLKDSKFFFFGAGEAATGIARLVVMALVKGSNLSVEEAREHCVLFDSRGIVCEGRKNSLKPHKVEFAHKFAWEEEKESEAPRTLLEAVKAIKPTALIGTATQPGAFNKDVVEEMSALNSNPIIFALSNPTSKAECTFQDTYTWSKGKVIYASGSPFPPITDGDLTVHPAQANNALTNDEELEEGKLLPPFSQIQDISIQNIASLCLDIFRAGLCGAKERLNFGKDAWLDYVREMADFA